MVLLNGHEEDEVKANLKRLGRCQNVGMRHLRGNPLHREDLKKARQAPLCNVLASGTSPRLTGEGTTSEQEHMNPVSKST